MSRSSRTTGWRKIAKETRKAAGRMQSNRRRFAHFANTIVPCLFVAGSVLELLDTSNLELRILSTAIAANVLAFSDSLLLTNEECIDGFSDCMEVLLDAVKR